ncbi:MAG: acireductone synthase [Leptolyngbya sp. SIO4C1]|nr:acireductone synthase [Leptolyngbya sp. SIO4C1]
MLDIEGTTTPVAYVFEVLFPFARDRVQAFLAAQGQAAQADLALLRQEYQAETDAVPAWSGDEPVAAVPYIHYLIARDRKSTGLKSLQGKLWNAGYRSGELRSQLFPDVKPAFERWQAAGKAIYIFSSGSVQAQQLIFRYSQDGDLTPYISGYFDTTTGPKREVSSYQKIAQEIGTAPNDILFISDVVAELQPAQAAGFQTLFSQRPGNHSDDSQGVEVIHAFDQVQLTQKALDPTQTVE